MFTPRDKETGRRLPGWGDLPRYPVRRRVLYVGLPGSGKSLLMVHAALQAMRDGFVTFANFDLYHRPLGLRAGRLGSWDDFMRVCALEGRSKLIVIQEANNACSSRAWSKLPEEVHTAWAQVRHFGVEMMLDAQHEKRVDLVMREILDYIVICEPTGYVEYGLRIFRETQVTPEDAARVRSVLGREDGNEGESNAVPVGDSRLRFPRGWEHVAYDTHEPIMPWRYAESGVSARFRMPARWLDGAWVDDEVVFDPVRVAHFRRMGVVFDDEDPAA